MASDPAYTLECDEPDYVDQRVAPNRNINGPQKSEYSLTLVAGLAMPRSRVEDVVPAAAAPALD